MQTAITTKPVRKLTKENFWNDMHEQFPKAMNIFCEWVDEYKEKNKWDVLFGSLFPTYKPKVKYHELPFAMQIGIWMEFVFDQQIYWVFDFSTDLKTDIRDFLAVLEVK